MILVRRFLLYRNLPNLYRDFSDSSLIHGTIQSRGACFLKTQPHSTKAASIVKKGYPMHTRFFWGALLALGLPVLLSQSAVFSQTAVGQAVDDVNPTAPTSGRSVQWNSNILVRELALAVGHPLVLSNLELLPYQVEQLKQLQYEMQNEITTTAREYSRLKPDQRDARLTEVYVKTREEMERVLLPKQSQRLSQIAVQSLGPVADAEDGMSMANLLMIPTIRDELQIDRQDLDTIVKAAQEQNEILKREIAELKLQSNRTVLSKINSELRAKIQSLVGDPFDFGGYQLGRGGVFRKTTDN